MNNPELDNKKCLSLDVMRLYQERQLPDRAMHQVEKHLLDCNLCSDVMEGLEVQDIPVINSIASNVNKKIAAIAGMPPTVQPSFFNKYKWFFIVPAALIIGWFAWNRMSSDTGPVERPGAGNQPSSGTSQAPAPVMNNTSNEKTVVREPQLVEKSVPSPAENVREPEERTEVKTNDPVVVNNIPAEPEAKDPVKNENTVPAAEEKPGNNTNNNTSKTTPAPADIDYSNLKIIEVKVINKVATASGGRKSSSNGQIGGNKIGSVDDGLQPHEMPVFYGGDEAMKTWLVRNFKNPVKDKRELKGMTTAVIFDVSSKGKIDNIEITKSLSKDLDTELLRLIESMPQWKAAAKKGTIQVVLAITFK